MAFLPTDGLRYNVQPDVVRIAGVYNAPMIARLAAKGRTQVTRQRQIKWNVDAAWGSVLAQASSADVSSQSNDTVAAAILPVGDNRLLRSFSVQLNERTEAGSIGVGELADLLQFEVDTAIESIISELATRLYTAGSNSGISKGFADLGATASSNKSTVVYAGLDPATYTRWTNLVYANGGTPRALTTALLRTVMSDMKSGATIGTNAMPTALYMNPLTANSYKALFDDRVLPQYGQGVADVSYSTLMFEGIEIVEDPYCPAGSVFFISEPQVNLYTFDHPGALGTVDNTQFGTPLSFYVSQIASSNPEGAKFTVLCNPQLQVRNRAAVAILKDLI